MRKILVGSLFIVLMASLAYAQLTFYLVDNFEDGTFTKWYVFDSVKAAVVDNPAKADKDSIAEACGDKSLKIAGSTNNWYAGGMGTILDVDGADYTRFVVDVYGSKAKGKMKVELFEKKSASGTEEAKWVVELPVLGEGFTRYSIPFSSFSLDDPNKIVFHGKNGGKISKLQLIFVASQEKGNVDLTVDNLIFTF